MRAPPVARKQGVDASASVRTVTAAQSPYVVVAADDCLIVDATDGAVVITVPSVQTVRKAYLTRRLTVKKIDGTANPVIVTACAGDTIDGAPTVVLSTQYQLTTILTDLSSNAWWIVIGWSGSALLQYVPVTVGPFIVTDGAGAPILIPWVAP